MYPTLEAFLDDIPPGQDSNVLNMIDEVDQGYYTADAECAKEEAEWKSDGYGSY